MNIRRLILGFFIVASVASSAEAGGVLEKDLPRYKHCRVWLRTTGEFIVGHKKGVATFYRCDGDIFVLEMKNDESEKPFQIDWSQVIIRDQNGRPIKDIRRIYTFKNGVYILTEYHWEETKESE